MGAPDSLEEKRNRHLTIPSVTGGIPKGIPFGYMYLIDMATKGRGEKHIDTNRYQAIKQQEQSKLKIQKPRLSESS